MEARDDRVVGISYVLRDGQGEELERREDSEPLYYLHGHENIIPALEDTLGGLEEGDGFDVKFEPEEAYGEYNPNMIQRVGKDQFPEGLELKPGTPVQLVAEGGAGSAIFYIKEIAGEEVVLDGNQPLAGKTLQFEGQIVDIREATDEEIDHGHAHVGDVH